MKKQAGMFLVLVAVCVIAALLSPAFLGVGNLENLTRRIGLFGIIGIGVAFVIVTGGIDLSIGSVVCLTGCGLPWLLVQLGLPPWLALPVLLGVSAVVGLWHGWLVAVVKLQPFVVTLCGLLVYRGLMRGVTQSQSQGFGSGFQDLRWWSTGKLPPEAGAVGCALATLLLAWMAWRARKSGRSPLPASAAAVLAALIGGAIMQAGFQVPMPCVILIVLATLTAAFFHLTVWGRHLLALGSNEKAARFSGIATTRLTLLAYVACALLAGIAGMLFVMEVGSAQPSDFGNFYELYAIAAAVIGGCSLRGGRISVVGVVLGAALMQVLRNVMVLAFPSQQQLELAVIGVVILLGVLADAGMRRLPARK
ncbi:MAG: ABC transporter permease [Akkermansiaceae bacterium]|jgi:ribose transport system permease protein|nr:ABC transporter permease [Akkermansiaceae bacterium]